MTWNKMPGGVKWGPYHCTPAEDIAIAEHCATYAFTTAWRPPGQYYLAASSHFPALIFAVSWGGEGPSFGRAVYAKGACLEQIVGDYKALPDSRDDDGLAYQKGVEHYLANHHPWVEALISQS